MAGNTKRPGKTEWAGRRRPAIRKSGFSASYPVRVKVEDIPATPLRTGETALIEILFTPAATGNRIGFGGWLSITNTAEIQIDGCPSQFVCSDGGPPTWRKLGSQWLSIGDESRITISIRANEPCEIAVYEMCAGEVEHEVYETASDELLKNMHQFAPEANFYVSDSATVTVHLPTRESQRSVPIYLKSCNRCGRYLPINHPSERDTLSYSNHCVSRAPCTHASFGKITDADNETLEHHFHFGFQLECRFCKKFFVNAPLNPQRTAGQMKEDAARRRAFELLLEHLNEGSPQLDYSDRTGHDLAEDVFQRFGERCFKCNVQLKSAKEMHLDHTRPLARLWPLDKHATALCADCNSAKRDRAPIDFYNENELIRLSEITQLPMEELLDPSPNIEAIDKLEQHQDWFFEEFITSGQLEKVREGKNTAALLVKALQKTINRYPGGAPYDLEREAKRRGIH